ncbi:hypothetical protein J6590_077258 [Homalodisca vitripennis]|nr:hypothetical protein J6590_077258 [Homalodisca vitripennis]
MLQKPEQPISAISAPDFTNADHESFGAARESPRVASESVLICSGARLASTVYPAERESNEL